MDQYGDPEVADEVFRLTTLQLGNTQATVIARDATSCEPGDGTIYGRLARGKYHYYLGVRTPDIPDDQGRHCTQEFNGPDYHDLGQLQLDYFAFESEALAKAYYLGVITQSGETYPR